MLRRTASLLVRSAMFALAAGTLLPAPARAADPAPKKAGGGEELVIGYVSLQRAILEVEEGKRAKKALKSTFDAKQKKLSQREEELMKLKEAIEKQGSVTADAETRKRAEEFQLKLVELRNVFMKEQQELQELEQKELSGITSKMRKIIEEIGQQQGYTLILEVQESRLLYAKRHLDLTDEIIRKYNQRYK